MDQRYVYVACIFLIIGCNLSIFCVGPPLPKTLWGFEVVNIGLDIIVISGAHELQLSNNHFNRSPDLFRFSCTNNVCQWETLPQKLVTPRVWFVAIPIPDDFIECD